MKLVMFLLKRFRLYFELVANTTVKHKWNATQN